MTNRYVYRIQNLPLVETPNPCEFKSEQNKASRFVRKNAGSDSRGCHNGNTDSDYISQEYPEIVSAIESYLRSTDPRVRDSVRVIDITSPMDCTDTSDETLGASFTVPIPASSSGTSLSSSCWTHSYEHEWSVFVMNQLVVTHPGNAAYYLESRPNPIADVAERFALGSLKVDPSSSSSSRSSEGVYSTNIRSDLVRNLQEDTSAYYCGCQSCTPEVWASVVAIPGGSSTCGTRIEYLQTALGYDEAGACAKVSDDFYGGPCGPVCNPRTCNDDGLADGGGGGGSTSYVLDSSSTNTNLAFGKSSTASSRSQIAAYAFDGSPMTRWESDMGIDMVWLQVDLGAMYELGKVTIYWEDASAKAYDIQVSTDGSSFTTVWSQTPAPEGFPQTMGTVESAFEEVVTGRYVRMQAYSRATEWGYSIWEMSVFGNSPTVGSTSPSPSRKPTPAPSARPATAAPSKEPDTPRSPRCGCTSCNEDVLNAIADDFSCEDRINWIMENFDDVSESDSCRLTADDYPSICGMCHTDHCGTFPPPTPSPPQGPISSPSSSQSNESQQTYCGCDSCTQEVWDTAAADSNGMMSCGERINWLQSAHCYSERDACITVSSAFFEGPCGPVCDPTKCNSISNPQADLEESVTLNYPSCGSHLWNFHTNEWLLDPHRVGNFGDTISFNELPNSAKSAAVITALGGSVAADSGPIIEVCGSPGEVGNDPSFGHQYLLQKYGDAEAEPVDTLDQDHEPQLANQMVWTTVSLNAPDQLRHRVSWALSSIFVVTENDIEHEYQVEPWAVFYDIFVRHAFGNFFDILKEVSFSPLMGEMLTYKGSKSMAYHAERNGVVLFPDENFAREIMQLFSIGLYMLNQDGSKVFDETTGQPVPAYSNYDIVNFARGWTNFDRHEAQRDNIEALWSLGWIENSVDPMWLPTSEGRDVFPKFTLNVNGRGYVGDKVQRCDSMPSKDWLRKGAVYQFREDSLNLMGKKDPNWWARTAQVDDVACSSGLKSPFCSVKTTEMILDPEISSLYAKLCNFNDETGACEFKSTVILDQDIPCAGRCVAGPTGNSRSCECNIDDPRTVRIVQPNSPPVWYEYVRAPCVQMSFPENGYLRAVREIGASGYGNKAMCADSRYAVAGTTCCNPNGLNPFNICVFKGERATYQTAQDRCAAFGTGYSTCSWTSVGINYSCGTDTGYEQGTYSVDSAPGMRFSWMNKSCSVNAQINRVGDVAIVHSVGHLEVKERVRVGTGTFFGVLWDDGSYPTVDSNCESIPGFGPCQVHEDTCICSTSVETAQVFDGSKIPTTDDVLSQLHIGAPDPNLFDVGAYNLCAAQICMDQSYNIYTTEPVDVTAPRDSLFNSLTIFEVTDPKTGSSLFLSNTKSMVHVGGGYKFRNPPMYNSPVDQTQRDGLYETDAILQQYVTHPNTAPFISTKLINHLISSNPSPRYVKAVSDAFRTGTYASGGNLFGGGKYGDMGATIAAIMLDGEARSSTLDDDSNHGRAREPLLKIMHLFRSMKLSTESGDEREIDMIDLMGHGIGQEVFHAPSVFSFFLSEHQPVGPVLNKGLVSPEAQLFGGVNLISFVNGLFSLPVFGLTDCQKGFGEWRARYWIRDYPDGHFFDCDDARSQSPGVPLRLRWKPPSWGGETNVNNAPASAVIDDIDLLLTGGRLHAANRVILEQVYNTGKSDDNALQAVMQHYAAVPEFHVTNNLVNSKSSATTVRAVPNIEVPENPSPVKGYKAIVYIFLAGGMDSYSALVPLGCSLHAQYLEVRGDVAIASDLLKIDASDSNQPCETFGIHPSLGNIHQLYDRGDASFVSNIGPLVVPLDKHEFEAGKKSTPQALFAHNIQTKIVQAMQYNSAGGVLGRIGDVINAQEGEEVFNAYSTVATPKILEGAPGVSRPADILDERARLSNISSAYEDNIVALSQNMVTSIYGETFSASMTHAIYRMRYLGRVSGTVSMENGACFDDLGTSIADQLSRVGQQVKSRDSLQSKRDVYYTELGGFDTHSDNGPVLTSLLKEMDDALGCFVREMKNQDIWNNVTIVSASEFGRTLTSNGQGTDHGWPHLHSWHICWQHQGGNHWVAGGSVRGRKIHGQYPEDLSDQGILNIGRGRLIPTTPWEGLWNAMAEWFGIANENISAVLPNLGSFDENIFSADELFENK
ncbi:hypothetical protein ACHAXR_011178 [Thalassiosira sp. AJA248-18]